MAGRGACASQSDGNSAGCLPDWSMGCVVEQRVVDDECVGGVDAVGAFVIVVWVYG